MNKLLLISILSILIFSCAPAKKQKVFNTTADYVKITNNNKTVAEQWFLDTENSPDITEVECKEKMNKVTFSDTKDSISFFINKGEVIDFYIIKNKKDSVLMRVKGIAPILNFTDDYKDRNRDKINVEVPKVSELATILIALHKDTEKDVYMSDTSSEYYKRVKAYFKPYVKHPIMDTIHKYVNGLRYIESIDDSIFSNHSYTYYNSLKMNACAFEFTADNKVRNQGFIRDMAYKWYTFNPMKDSLLIEDFAKKSNFNAFYEKEQAYYKQLIADYKTLNPLSQMKSWLDNKFGFSYDNFTVYFSPLVYGSHSAQKFEDDGFKQTFMFIAKATLDKEQSLIQNILKESRVVFTEIDHNYVNPISDTFLKEIDEALKDNNKWVQSKMSSDAYSSPYMVFNEYMTFGMYTLYVYDNYGEKELEAYLPRMERLMVELRGFHRFKEFNNELLRLYKENPKQDIKTLYKHILDWCKKI